MKIEIKLADNMNGFIIKNMYPLYLHDLSGIHGTLPNEYGIFEEEPIRTLGEQYDIQQVWFENPAQLFPYLIIADNIPAGFCLVGSGKYVPSEVDYYIYETFLLSPFRGKEIAHYAMLEIFEKHRGKWKLFTQSTENNIRAKAFWHKTIAHYTENKYTSEEKIIEGMPKLVFRFEN
ncbi:Predicted acetyltransferase [Anaerocolumna jejuensis DSM 15929]|uniref:Predicted acetyltransferase n=1 Tax=Anaerocolumna jejuensis DSM 15929 TaxID=1121322 RepID=A0A1M6T9K6_9FIRM|nr:GNAT family N-acetyltransferase [Anaerocolumna jejuensis]SHK53564.1 Predicted acetyltransferase [Anaerocolumna jejuensis DSM 15929]